MTQNIRVPSAFRVLRRPEDEWSYDEWLDENEQLVDVEREREARRVLREIEDRKLERKYGPFGYIDWRKYGF